MIERTCKVLNKSFGPYRDVTWAKAAKRAVTELIWNGFEVNCLPASFDVEVTDAESGITRTLFIEVGLRLEWTNPREVSGD